MRDKVLIGYGRASGATRSSADPPRARRPIDYLVLDYLAEVTMSIMQKLRSRDPAAGYASDFVALLERILEEVVSKKIKVVANAGG